mgnify:CR=1 FL=1
MSFTLKLDSSSLNQDSDNFTVNFANPIVLNTSSKENEKTKYEIALITADLWYSFSNISSELGNNTFKYYNGSVWRDVTLPNGNFQISDINDFLEVTMDQNSDYTTDPDGNIEYNIVLAPNIVTLKVELALKNGYKLDLTTSKLNELLGFNQAIYDTTTSSTNRVDITRGVNSLAIHCNIAGGSFDNNLGSDILYSFVPQSGRGSAIHIEPNYPIYLPVSEEMAINRIQMRITDQLNRRVNFNGEPITYFLHIRRAL